MKTVISSKGQIVLPAEIRKQDNILNGQQFTVERLEAGHYLLKRVLPDSSGVLQWLRDCPESDWFEPLPSEMTDTL